jgi:hypothetical protein
MLKPKLIIGLRERGREREGERERERGRKREIEKGNRIDAQ